MSESALIGTEESTASPAAVLADLLLANEIRQDAAQCIPVQTIRDRFPLTFAQQRMLVLHEMDPQGSQYLVPFAMRLRGTLDVPALERALTELTGRHEVLRTRIAILDGGPMQIVLPATAVTIPLEDVMPGEVVEDAIQRFIKGSTRKPFHLASDPVLRCALLRIDERDHVLVLTMHHIFSDAWSSGLLARELDALYASFTGGNEASLPSSQLQYGDYAAWQRTDANQQAVQAQLEYWKKRLSGAPPTIDLPIKKPRPAEMSYAGDFQRFRITPEQAAQLRQLGRENVATLFMTMLALVTGFLARYTGQDDVLIGTPVAGRGLPELEGVLGLFANMLVMRNSVAEDPTLREMIEQTRDHAFEAYENQDVSFELLVQEVQPERDLARNPLFQVLLMVQAESPDPWRFRGLQVERLATTMEVAKFDLSFTFAEQEKELIGTLTYNTELFDRPYIERMAEHFCCFVSNALRRPDEPLSTVEMLSSPERRMMLEEFNATERNYAADPRDRSGMHQLFEDQVRVTPNNVALVAGGRELTYLILDKYADRIAQALMQRGFGAVRESIIAICLPRTEDLISAMLGVLKAGCVLLMLDPSYPAARLAGMIEDAAPGLLITTPEISVHLPSHMPRLLMEEATCETRTSPKTPREVDGRDAAYIIYTSGSSGRPKGTVIEHRSAVTLLHWARETWSARDLSGVLGSTSVCFDLAIFEIFAPLSWGGTLILAENALDLPDLPERHRVTLVNTVPSAMAELIRMQGIPASVRTINLAGEALSRQLVDELYMLGHVESVYNLYGPSEDTTYSTCSRLPRENERGVSIGRPVANTRAYVLGRGFGLLPRGVTGELHLAGEGLARCYLNRPELTAERFLPNPFGPPGSRMYRTGDLARWQDAGELDYLGRVDHQVKLRGFRIEPGEIEATLLRHPGIAQALVMMREDRPGDRRLVAYFIPETGVAVQERNLRSELARTLPGFMIPALFVRMNAFPATANGKLDRKAFPAPGGRPELRQRYVPANDPLRSQLVAIWEDILNVQPVGIRDDFFEIGGDSLLAVQLMYRIRKACGIELPLGMLFRYPRIEDLATAMIEQESSGWNAPVVQLQAGDPAIKPPFFYLHADFVSGGFYSVDLAHRLSADQPFYTLQPHGLDGGDVPGTIEEMAEQHLATLRTVQPKGPYYLGGKCGGALIAFQMARLLREEGEEVRLLALVHGWAGALYRRVEQTLKPANRPPRLEMMHSANYQTRKVWAFYRYTWAIKTYIPGPYGGKITLLWPEGVPVKGPDSTLCWSQVSKTIERYTIPGDSYTCITRHIGELGAQLDVLLKAAQEE